MDAESHYGLLENKLSASKRDSDVVINYPIVTVLLHTSSPLVEEKFTRQLAQCRGSTVVARLSNQLSM
ncbi:MAG: hypothetical protein ACJA0Z_004389 [Halioglobus sp.]